MMRLINCEQRSSEWLELRRSKIGASDCAAVLGKSRYKSPRMVWKEKVHGTSSFITPSMQRGINLEPVAKEYFEALFCEKFDPLVALHDEHDWMLASLDGYNEEKKRLIEIKVVGKKTFEEVDKGNIPPEYEWQVQHQLCVTGAEMGYLAFYHPTDDLPKVVSIGIGRDEEMISLLLEKEKEFYFTNILGYVEPAPGDMDFIERLDTAWYEAAMRYRGVKERREALEEEEKMLREKLIELSGDESSQGYGVRVSRYKSQGRIDYKKIPQLEGIDLEPFRSESSIAWRITV